MSLTRYDGKCFRCGKFVPAGKGDFQARNSLSHTERVKYIGKWLVRCFACRGLGNKSLITK